MSQRKALGAFREAGGAISDSVFRAQWNGVLAADARSSLWQGFNVGRAPEAAMWGERPVGKPGTYMIHMNVTYQDIDTGEMSVRPFIYPSWEPPVLTDVVDEVMDYLEGFTDAGGGQYKETVAGITFVNGWKAVAR